METFKLSAIEKSYKVGDVIRVKGFVRHPMDTGFAKNHATGEKIPAHYLTKLVCTIDGVEFCTVDIFPTTSRNPQFVVPVKVTKAGAEIKFTMTDNKGEQFEGTMAAKPK